MPVKTDWVDGNTVDAAAMNQIGEAIENRAGINHDHDLAPSVGLVIVEITEGVWSSALPARDPGVNPAFFISKTDPSDATNGVDGAENINARDRWIELDSL